DVNEYEYSTRQHYVPRVHRIGILSLRNFDSVEFGAWPISHVSSGVSQLQQRIGFGNPERNDGERGRLDARKAEGRCDKYAFSTDAELQQPEVRQRASEQQQHASRNVDELQPDRHAPSAN